MRKEIFLSACVCGYMSSVNAFFVCQPSNHHDSEIRFAASVYEVICFLFLQKIRAGFVM